MIIAHSGTPGSGKTYDAVVRIIDNLKKGRIVYTNIHGFDDSSCRELIRQFAGLSDDQLKNNLIFLNEEDLNSVWKIETPALIVLDELQNYFSNRDWNTEGNKLLNRWAAVHRHKGQDLIVISHSIEGIDSQLRRLIEWTYDYRKINFLGGLVSNSYIMYIYPQDNINQKYLSKKTSSYEKKIFYCYKSYVASDLKELKIVKSTNILKHPIFFAIPVVICLLIFLFFRSSIGTGNLFGVLKKGAGPLKVFDKKEQIKKEGLSAADQEGIKNAFASQNKELKGVAGGDKNVQVVNGVPDKNRGGHVVGAEVGVGPDAVSNFTPFTIKKGLGFASLFENDKKVGTVFYKKNKDRVCSGGYCYYPSGLSGRGVVK